LAEKVDGEENTAQSADKALCGPSCV